MEAALGLTVHGLIEIIGAMRTSVAALEAELAREFAAHKLAPILCAVPGLGPVLGARVLAEIGDDPKRFTSVTGIRAFAGTAPVTRASGRSHYVKARKIRNKRLADACHCWAFSALTWSAGAHAHYDHRRVAETTTTPLYATSQTNSSDDSGGAWPLTNPGTMQRLANPSEPTADRGGLTTDWRGISTPGR